MFAILLLLLLYHPIRCNANSPYMYSFASSFLCQCARFCAACTAFCAAFVFIGFSSVYVLCLLTNIVHRNFYEKCKIQIVRDNCKAPKTAIYNIWMKIVVASDVQYRILFPVEILLVVMIKVYFDINCFASLRIRL